MENGVSTEIFREQIVGDNKNFDYKPKVQLTEETSQLKVVVSDGREGKEVIGIVKTYVNMEVVQLKVGSYVLANAEPFALISLNDMKTYSVDEAISTRKIATCFTPRTDSMCIGTSVSTPSSVVISSLPKVNTGTGRDYI